jgi:hypothetical protein
MGLTTRYTVDCFLVLSDLLINGLNGLGFFTDSDIGLVLVIAVIQ